MTAALEPSDLVVDLTQGALIESGQLLGAGEKQAARKRNRAGSGARRRVPAPIVLEEEPLLAPEQALAPEQGEARPLVEEEAKGAERFAQLLNSAEAGYAELTSGG